jgi:glutamate dehydrogenase
MATDKAKIAALADRVAVRQMKAANFKSEAIIDAVHTFFSVGLEPSYFALHDEERISEHVYGYLCALVAPPDASGRKGFFFASERKNYAFYLCRANAESIGRTEQLIEDFIARHAADRENGISIRTYTSKTAPTEGTDGEHIMLYSVERAPFKNPKLTTQKAEWTMESLATEHFLKSRSQKSLARYNRLFERLRTSFAPVVYSVEEIDDGLLAFQIAFNPDRVSYFRPLTVLLSTLDSKAIVTKKFLETFSNGIQVYSFYFRGASKEDLERVGSQMAHLPNRNLLRPVMDMFLAKNLSSHETLYATAVVMFAFYFTSAPTSDDFTGLIGVLQYNEAGLRKVRSLRDDMFRELMSEGFICTVLVRHITAFRALYTDFAQGTTPESIAKLRSYISSSIQSKTERDVFLAFAKFNAAVRRTNFFRTGAAAVAFRLDPSFIQELDFPRVPYAIYMVVGAQFRGFHVRFADIARGGVRMIYSRGETPADIERAYRRNKTFLFNENYNLAHTQMLKNKDIPESGSKGTILVSTRAQSVDSRTLFLQYVDALLDLMLPNVEGVRDTLGKDEILFLGPDEGTAGAFPSIAALHAKSRGYPHWKSFTTGKTSNMGGIPHDAYGMTTRSIRQYAKGVYAKLGLDESKLTKFMTGGPDGDLGSNEIIMGREKIIAICDGFASVHDPDGINRDELVRLATHRLSLKDFNKEKLGPKGFHVGVQERNKQLPDGSVVADGTAFRNKFHFMPYTDADVFIPCGGRPASVDLHNVHLMLKGVPNATADVMLAGKLTVAPSQLRYRFVVEGANLFLTQDARLALENCGMLIFKDSSTNKGGVTSSSLEVLAGLALKDSEHSALMCVPDGKPAPEFYQTQVREICERIEGNARREFECIWRESKTGYKGGSKTLISDELSRKINSIKTFVQNSDMHTDAALFRFVISQYVLPSTLKQVPLDEILTRVPKAYLVAIFAIYIASNFVYETGLEHANEFSFFQFMQKLTSQAAGKVVGKL